MTGKYLSVTKDIITNKVVLTLEVNEEIQALENYENLKDKSLNVTIKEHKEKRSLNANAYFHTLADKLRFKIEEKPISMARMKNLLIADYGQVQYINDEQMIYKTNAPEEYMLELETIHSKCVKISKENDKEIYFYRIYRGSSTYNTEEMSKLINGTVEECKLQGIETMAPTELNRLLEMWGKNEKHNTGK